MKRFFGRLGLLMALMSIYFISYTGSMFFFKTSQLEQEGTVEDLATWYDSQYPDATPWETCIQEED